MFSKLPIMKNGKTPSFSSRQQFCSNFQNSSENPEINLVWVQSGTFPEQLVHAWWLFGIQVFSDCILAYVFQQIFCTVHVGQVKVQQNPEL